MFSRFCRSALQSAIFLLAVLALGITAYPQSQVAGAMGGLVTDAQKAAVPGATITVVNTGTNASSSTTSASDGRYLITNLQPGTYSIEVNAPNFGAYKQTDIHVEVGLATTVDAQLAVAGQVETVTVNGQAPVINTLDNNFATNFNQTALNNLPINSRRWSNFALSTPGAIADGTFGDIAFRGIGYIFDNNTVDGASNTQAFFAEEVGRTRMGYSTSLNSVQEFQVTTSNFSAEYGRAVGGVINAVTKSGTNQLHGDLFYFNRDNTIGGAYTPFATGAVVQPNGTYLTEPIKPLDIRQQLGGDVGGRIIKDKLFWYFNFDGFIHHFPATNIPTTPANFFTPIVVSMPSSCTGATLIGSLAPKTLTPGQILACRGFTQAQLNSAITAINSTTGTSPRTGDQTIFFPKLDWHPTANNSITASYNRVRWSSPYGVQTGSVVARSIDSNGNDYVHDDRAVADWNTVLTSTMLNELRFVYSRDFEFEFTTPSLPGEPVSSLTGLSPQIDINGCGFSNGGSTTQACGWTMGAPYYLERPAYPNEKRYQVQDTFGITKGTHSIKFGIDISHTGDLLNSYASGDQLGEYSYTYYQDYLSDYIASVDNIKGGRACATSAGLALPCYNDYFQTFGPLSFNVPTLEASWFVQDDWNVTKRLTINAGLRWDHEGMPAPVLPNSAIPQTTSFPSDNKDFGPRIGFAWDVTGQGKTVVRGGYGLYYGRITNEQIYEAMTQTGLAGAQLSPTIFPTTGSSNSLGSPTPGEPLYPNILASYSASVGTPNISYFPSDMRLPAAEEFDAVLEHEILPNTMVSLSYIGSIGRFLPIGIDTNLPPASKVNYTIVGSGPLTGDTVAVPYFTGTSRPNRNYQQMVMYCTCVTSHYNALVAQFNRRFTGGIQFNFSYTYASDTDDAATSTGSSGGSATGAAITSDGPVVPGNLGLEEGASNLEVRNRFVGTFVWQPAHFAKSSNAFERAALSGWTWSFDQIAQSGMPYIQTVSGNLPSGKPGVGGVSSGGYTGGKTSSRATFVPKNSNFLPATVNTDMRLARSFSVRERYQLQLTLEAFNLFNHVDYTAATGTAYTVGGTAAAPTLTYSTSFGGLTAANNGVFYGARQLQLGAKFSF